MDFGILLLCITVFVIIIVTLVYLILNIKEKKYIKSIKVGDIFVYSQDVDSYYRRINDYKHYSTNPFDPNPKTLYFPSQTCIIKELKESKTGEMWVCYNLVDTPDEITIAENTSNFTNHYRTLDDFLELRERVKRFEI